MCVASAVCFSTMSNQGILISKVKQVFVMLYGGRLQRTQIDLIWVESTKYVLFRASAMIDFCFADVPLFLPALSSENEREQLESKSET